MIGRVALVFLAFAGLASAALAASAVAKEEFPKFTNYVVDAAGVVPQDAESRINSELEAYDQRSGVQIAVAVIETTGDASLEDYTIDLAKEWGVGEADNDNGVLLLIAYEDRRMRIEVGEGIEGELTDLESGRIIREHIRPRLHAGDVGDAILSGTREIRRAIGDDQAVPVEDVPSAPAERPSVPGWAFAVLPFVIFPWIARLRSRRRAATYWSGGSALTRATSRRDVRRRRGEDEGNDLLSALLLGSVLLGGRRGGWGGGDFGSGGGFGGGGGGDFGGGGASGDW